MSIEKYQRFLKIKHKFDAKPLLSDVLDDFKHHTTKFLEAVAKESKLELETTLRPFLIDLIKHMNRYDITFEDLIKDEYNQ